MKIVKLKNGSEELEVVVRSTMLVLNTILKDNHLAIYELVTKCRNNEHDFYGNIENELIEYGIVEKNGNVHDSVRNVVLSAFTGEGANMEFRNPY